MKTLAFTLATATLITAANIKHNLMPATVVPKIIEETEVDRNEDTPNCVFNKIQLWFHDDIVPGEELTST